jgi:hypothetical protein
VIVRKNPTFKLQENITLEGEILYSGKYPKLNEKETLSAFFVRAGGLKENADPSAAKLYRLKDSTLRGNAGARLNKIRYIKDTSGKIIDSVVIDSSEPIIIELVRALANPGSKYDVVLQEGDVVVVPELNPIVSVKGAVQNNLKLYFENEHKKLGYYIDRAGGFGERPWRSRIYVTYANGKSRKTKNFGFFHFYPKVEAGSIVVVPARPDGKAAGSFVSQVLITSLPIFVAFLLAKVKL